MTDKIKSFLVDRGGDLKAKYEEIYRSADTWLYPKSHGVHSTVVQVVRDWLPGARVLDLGCGAGRLSLMCRALGAETHGVDFSETAIALAKLASEVTRTGPITFTVETAESFVPRQPFDIIILVGVLEHVPDPAATLRQMRSWLAPGGRVVISCPNFINLRGYAYMPLLTLFGLPMSLADLRQVSYRDIDAWSAETGFRRCRTAGAIYRFAWGAKGVQDLIRRVPLAARDKGLDAASLDFAAFDGWLRAQAEPGEWLLDALEARHVLKRIERPVTFDPQPVSGTPPELFERLRGYVNEDVDADPYWSDQEPFCYHGGEAIYVLETS
jgi:2-polyprenyl-3-methyl-5-hydroxy-6-metoxy-1,4-benzoquinol methylase